MLDLKQVRDALESQKSALLANAATARESATELQPLLVELEQLSKSALLERLGAHALPGALPTLERESGKPLIHPFNMPWGNRVNALAWAREILSGVPTCAVDGSQIEPDRDYSVAIGAVQAGCFINAHMPGSAYSKTLRFELLSATDLAAEADDSALYAEQVINLRRFELECRVIVEQLRAFAGSKPLPLVFLDGSFILSFAGFLGPGQRQAYTQAVKSVLDASRQYSVPVIGFVDSSYAHDFVRMMESAIGQALPSWLTDAGILGSHMGWGDRSELWQCARDDRLSRFAQGDGSGYYGQVHFTYLKTTVENPPARIELPEWTTQTGLTDSILDMVRAECIVGSGYPYPLETADALAVLDMQDRERFYRMLQDYLVGINIPLRYARKAASKRSRR